MKAIGRHSIASILSVVLRILSVLLWIAAGLAAFAGLGVLLSSLGLAIPSVQVDELPPSTMVGLSFAILVVTFVASLVIVGRLRKIFATLAEGDPFVEQNAVHLRVVWVTLAIWELCRYAFGGMAAAALYIFDAGALGAHEFNVDVSLSVWFAVLALIVLAEVFREGARLRQEQKLTI